MGLLSFYCIINGLICIYPIIINRLKDIDLSKIENIKQSSFIYDADDNLITSIYGIENRINIPLSDIPQHVRDAFINVEDIRFTSIMGSI